MRAASMRLSAELGALLRFAPTGGPGADRRENVLRFGDYTTDQLHVPPPAYNPTLHTTTEEAGGVRLDTHDELATVE
ncbi:hypothetical protein ACFWDI_26240 [Streptomyces sp. NPDC060064]|uniref:hypothetical protein n=1 Tax=Streptomyces sp. NPDC060064 TaxID=3347049 RepID=UPI0036CC63A9